jgi:2-methylcitrate dehydratase PrpD
VVNASQSVSERLADHVHGLSFEDLPGPVVDKTKDLLIHHLGLALRGHDDPVSRQAVHVGRYLSGSNDDCTVIGEHQGASLLDAVFVNSLLMGYHELDDFQLPPGVHQGVVTYPVALAFGEHTGVSGRDLIAAVVAGYDVVAKLAQPMFSWELPLPRHPYTLFAAFGSAAVAARLLHLSPDHTAYALAHAAHLGVGLIEAGSLMVPLEPMVARNGAMAAVLAQAGVPMRLSSIEGQHGLFRSYAGHVPDGLEQSLSTLGEVFEITNASPKRYGGSGVNIVPQELTLQLLKTHSLTADAIVRVDVTLPEEREQREMLMDTRIEDTSHSPVWSARFLLASVVASGVIDPYRYASHRDAQVEKALNKVHLRFEAGRPIRYCRVEITTTDSELHAAEGDDHVFPPIERFSWLAEGGRSVLSDEQLRHLVKLVDDLEDVDNVGELTDCLAPETSTAGAP